MGNKFECSSYHSVKDQREKPQIRNSHESHVSHPRGNCSATSDQILIKLHHEQMRKGITNQSSNKSAVIDKRRLVFVSLTGLYQTWHLCPAALLYSSIFILPLKTKWIYHQRKYHKEIRQSIIGEISIFKDKKQLNQFIDLLKWKDSHNLLFCSLDHHNDHHNDATNDDEKTNPLINAFWVHFNEYLTNLYDPITGTNYKSIEFSNKWWNHTYNHSIKSHYRVQPHKVLIELYFASATFKAMQEIIYQSNPESLHPIVSYNAYKNDIISKGESNKIGFVSAYRDNRLSDYGGFVTFPNGCCPDIDTDDDDDNDDNGLWVISTDYNEFNLTELSQ